MYRMEALLLLACLVLATGAGSARILSTHAARTPRAGAQALNPPPHTWHVVAGYTQALPPGNDNNEAINQFYPRTLTIYPGDSVIWTDNSVNEPHTITFAPDPLLRKLEDPNVQAEPGVINGKKVLVANPEVFFPSTSGPLVQHDLGSDRTLLNCGAIGPAGQPGPQSCTITFPHLGTYAYECLFHSGIPGNPDMDGVIKVIPRPQPANHTWTVWAGLGQSTDAVDGFFPPHLTIHVGDKVTWKAGGVYFHTVSFGLDPTKVPLLLPAGKGLIWNPQAFFPILPKNNIYTGGIASSGVVDLTGNYANLPGQPFVKAPFTLTFAKPGTYTYYCLVHGPLMKGTITVLPDAS